ncbi:MAG TPA: class I SAM-dependent methyltransferase [Acidimicrobiales bacterium]|nr:class I SAM-dependent methyltransferase [Acidimicrobiales bacterium]
MAPDPRTIDVTADVYEYLVAHGTPPDATYEAIRADTLEHAPDWAGMQIGPDQYAFLRLLVQIVGVELAVEVGTFTGTSATAIAGGLRPGGRLLCCDISEAWTSIARRHWADAGLDDRIDLRLAPALETLAALPKDQAVDFAFVDADKGGYTGYYEALVPRLRPGGVLVADNVLWSGRVVDPEATDDATRAIRAFNEHVAADDRVSKVMLGIGDGITICRKR